MIDSHCHLADEVFVADLDAVVARARAAGRRRGRWSSSPPSDDAEWARGRRRWPRRGRRCGSPSASIRTRRTCSPPTRPARPAAVGARGSTHGPASGPSARSASTTTTTSRRATCSRRCSAAQLALARARGLPVVIHTREAEDDTVAVIAEAQAAVRWPASSTASPATPAVARPGAGHRLPPVVRRHRDVPAGRRTARGRRASCPPIGCWSRPTARIWRRCRTAASATSRRWVAATLAAVAAARGDAGGGPGRRPCATTSTACSRGAPANRAAARTKRVGAALTPPERYGRIDAVRVPPCRRRLSIWCRSSSRSATTSTRSSASSCGTSSRRSASFPRSATTSRRAAASACARPCC